MSLKTLVRRPRTWFIAIPVLLVLGAVVGPWVYINLIEDDPPPKLTFADLTTTTSATASVADGSTPSTTNATAPGATAPPSTGAGIDGTWNVAPGSQAGYRVPETLFGQSTEAVGRTSGVSGTMTIAGSTVGDAMLQVDMTTVTSDQSQRDGQFRGRIMDVSTYPTATFDLTSPIDLGSVPADLAEVQAKASGELTMHGVTKPVTIDVAARRNGATIEVTGALPITFADWGISNPSLGPASVGDHGTMEFAVVFARA
jgi:polyisoprenoid-binding protein YceI